MVPAPSRSEQIITAHAGLIVAAARACNDASAARELESLLQALQQYGQHALVAAIREVLRGRRDAALLNPLDEDDRVVVESILRGAQDPSTLPDPNVGPDPAAAAPGLAAIIHGAAAGDSQALHTIAQMAEQMTAVGGDMGRLGGIIGRLVGGERDADALARGMGAQGESLVLCILTELARLERH